MVKKKLFELANNELVREIIILLILAGAGFLLFRALPGILNLILKLLHYD